MLDFFDMNTQNKIIQILLNVSPCAGNTEEFDQYLKPTLAHVRNHF